MAPILPPIDARANPPYPAEMSRPFILQGHRGARGLFPENTLGGFRATIALGVTSIELDVGLTADDVPVVVHDPVLGGDIVRGPDGAWLAGPGPRIRALHLADLAGYDVGRLRPGSAYAARFPHQVPQDGARIPTLAETFAAPGETIRDVALKTDPAHPDLTASPEEMLAAVLVAAAPWRQRLVLRSFDWRGLREAARIAPGIPRVHLTEGRTDPAAIRDDGGTTWAPDAASLTPALVQAAHRMGLAVLAWTVNAPDEMDRLIAWGVDGLCTDYPDLGRAAMARAGLPLPR